MQKLLALRREARRLFPTERNARKWVRAIHYLRTFSKAGWVYDHRVGRKA